MAKKDFNVLYVDDEKQNLFSFKTLFRRDYNILTALSGKEGIEIMDNHNVQLVITDQRMPEMTGVEFLERICKKHPDAIRIILTGYSDVDAIIKAINKVGIYQYITKPWDNDELKITIDNALETYRLKKENRSLVDSLRKANENLAEYNRTLEEKVKERTLEIENQKQEIENQRDKLQILNATKDKFFGIIAHDLKNHFTALLSITEALAHGFDDISKEDTHFYIKRVHKTANHLYELLKNLLEWSKAQAGRIDYTPEKFDLQHVVRENLSLLRMDAEKKNITIDTNISKPLKVFADINMTKTIIRNLLNNAIKYTENGGKIDIKAQKKGPFIEVSVIDTGIGLSKEDIKKLFRIDVKNKSIGTSKEKGTGLGLILSKEFVQKNGGRIGVISELGKGSTFYFTLPSSK